MDTLLEALTKYNDALFQDINTFKDVIKNDGIYFYMNQARLIKMNQAELTEKLAITSLLHEKMNTFIDDIKTTIETGKTTLTLSQRNKYFKNYELDYDDIVEIKKKMRCIKNRYYQQGHRDRKKNME